MPHAEVQAVSDNLAYTGRQITRSMNTRQAHAAMAAEVDSQSATSEQHAPSLARGKQVKANGTAAPGGQDAVAAAAHAAAAATEKPSSRANGTAEPGPSSQASASGSTSATSSSQQVVPRTGAAGTSLIANAVRLG